MAGSDPATVLVEAPVKDMVSGLDPPMAAVQLQQALRGGGLRAQAGDPTGGLDAPFAGPGHGDLPADGEDLPDAGEPDVVVDLGGRPDRSPLEAAVLGLPAFLDEVRGALRHGLVHQEPDVVHQGLLVALDREEECRAVFQQVVGKGALGQEGVDGDDAPRERAVRAAVGCGPCPKRVVELPRVDPDQHVADHRPARRDAGPVPEAHAEMRQDLGREVVDPFADRLVAAGAGQRRRKGEAEDRGQRVAPARRAPGVVDVPEELGHGRHLLLAEGHLGNSFLQAGFEMGVPEPDPRIAAQGQEEHALRLGMLPVARPGAAETPGETGLDPVGGAVDGPVEAGRVDIGLQQQEFVPEAGRPVPDEAARAQRERPRAEVARTARQDEEAGVVAHEVQAVEPHAAVPPDPAVARAALQRRRRENRQRQPAFVTVDDVADGFAHRRQRAEVVVLLKQAPEAGLLAFRYRADGHLRQIHDAAPFADSPRSRRNRKRAKSPETGSINWTGTLNYAGTDPP